MVKVIKIGKEDLTVDENYYLLYLALIEINENIKELRRKG